MIGEKKVARLSKENEHITTETMERDLKTARAKIGSLEEEIVKIENAKVGKAGKHINRIKARYRRGTVAQVIIFADTLEAIINYRKKYGSGNHKG